MNPADTSSSATPLAMDALLARLNTAAEAVWPPMNAALREASRLGPTTREGLTVEVLPQIDSTNSELMRRARAGQAESVLLVAADQTAGRGRMGKTWLSQPGDSLTFSLGLPLQPQDWAGLSLAVGVSLAESLGLLLKRQVELKWPNDVWLDGRKLAGVLVETAHHATARTVVVGVGINVAHVPRQWSASATGGWPGVEPTCVADHQPKADAADVLQAVAPALLRDVLTFEAGGFAAFVARFATHDVLLGRPLRLSDGTEGEGRGVDATGALLVMTPQGLRAVHSAEVSVRPVGTAGSHAC